MTPRITEHTDFAPLRPETGGKYEVVRCGACRIAWAEHGLLCFDCDQRGRMTLPLENEEACAGVCLSCALRNGGVCRYSKESTR